MAGSMIDLTQEELKRQLSYDPETGMFIWRVRPSQRVKIGDIAGSLGCGYREIRINTKLYRAHRLAWLWVNGAWPIKDLDHINGNPADNRMANLREATDSQNLCNRGKNRNNTSGFKGVSWFTARRKWLAQIKINGEKIHLGLFSERETAAAVYAAAALKFHGEFANVGR